MAGGKWRSGGINEGSLPLHLVADLQRGKPFDDSHWATTLRANPQCRGTRGRARRRRSGWWVGFQQLPAKRQCGGAPPAGEGTGRSDRQFRRPDLFSPMATLTSPDWSRSLAQIVLSRRSPCSVKSYKVIATKLTTTTPENDSRSCRARHDQQ